jgi:hypothetical protein
LQLLGADSAIFITAYNPHSQLLSDADNQNRNTELEQWIIVNGHLVIKGQGEDPTENWPPEASFLIPQLGMEEGKALGRYWEQNAVVFLRVEDVAQLVWCG